MADPFASKYNKLQASPIRSAQSETLRHFYAQPSNADANKGTLKDKNLSENFISFHFHSFFH